MDVQEYTCKVKVTKFFSENMPFNELELDRLKHTDSNC